VLDQLRAARHAAALLKESHMDTFRCEIEQRLPTTIMKLIGQIGLAEAEEFDRQVRAVAAAGPTRVVLDMSGLTMLSSAGIGALLRLQKTLGAKKCAVCLAALSQEIAQVLELSRLLSLFTISPTVAEAMN
jgi:anti-anti-sigma factor